MDESSSAFAIEEVFKLEIFQEYLKAFKKCASDYFDEDVLLDCFDGCKEFSIAVLGQFGAGKSTFADVVLSEKCSKRKGFPEFPVPALIRHGESSDSNITINYRNGDVKTLSRQDFIQEFGWVPYYESCQEVSYFELYSVSDMLSRNIVFAVMPGLQEDGFRTRTTSEFVAKANAIIFTMPATGLFSAKEKEYIAENYAGKEMRNVFFVIHRIDNLKEGQLESSVMPSVKAGFSDVFTDSKGHFNEQLYNSRVFFINAYGALCAHTGEPYKVILGRKEVPIPIELEDTGFPEFEEALLSFIEEQRRERCKLTMRLMVQTYQRLYEKTLEELKKDRCNSISYYEHNPGNNTDPRMGALQSMREYMGYCFEDLYGHQPTDLELSLMA